MAPLVVGGARLGLIFVVHGVIFAEMYGATEGVGRSILTWGEAFQMDYLLAAVLLVLLFTVVLNAGMKALENMAACADRSGRVSNADRDVVVVRGVSKRFAATGGVASFAALDDVSLTVPEGRFVSIVGPSGCGKSTLLQIIGGLAAATSGDVTIDGEPIDDPRPG